jgi:hypothetical protein
MGERVRLPGELVGNNRRVKCSISAIRVHLPRVPGVFSYKEVKITWVEQDVPIGTYQLSFENRSFPVVKTQDGWLAQS